MKKFILVTLAIFPVAAISAQEVAPVLTSSPAPTVSNSTPATAADVEGLRQQVQSLTETVKTLQQQVRDQQAALEKANLTGESGLPQNPEPSPIAAAGNSPVPAASAPSRFPTEDASVVTSASVTRARRNGPTSDGSFPYHRHLGRNIGTGNDLKHGCWRIVNATNHDWWRKKLHEHFLRRPVCACLLQRARPR